MIKMLTKTLKQMTPFAIMFFILMFMFMLAVEALNVPRSDTDNSNDYSNINYAPFELFLYVQRIALGDFQVSGLKRMQTATLVTAWFIWFAIVCINSIIFLNFLIAVVSDVFEQVVEKRDEENY
jgi:hypothetical protein